MAHRFVRSTQHEVDGDQSEAAEEKSRNAHTKHVRNNARKHTRATEHEQRGVRGTRVRLNAPSSKAQAAATAARERPRAARAEVAAAVATAVQHPA